MYLIVEQESPLIFKIIIALLAIFTAGSIVFFVIRGLFNFFEMANVEYFKRQLFFNHIYLNRKKITSQEQSILKNKFKFYNKLSSHQKDFFEHRVNRFINGKDFIGKEELQVTDEMKILIAATLVKLTFGLRDYNINVVDKVIIYPSEYYSTITKRHHKGEFNLGYKALVFSWEHFIHGYDLEDDNLNLAVHEFIHAIHFYYIKERRRSTSAAIFLDSYNELKEDLENNEALKNKMVSEGYFREYAFENQFEFLSVLVENFIETPSEFQSKFPDIYIKIKGMLNFNFAGY